jgi:hypothetical protein
MRNSDDDGLKKFTKIPIEMTSTAHQKFKQVVQSLIKYQSRNSNYQQRDKAQPLPRNDSNRFSCPPPPSSLPVMNMVPPPLPPGRHARKRITQVQKSSELTSEVKKDLEFKLDFKIGHGIKEVALGHKGVDIEATKDNENETEASLDPLTCASATTEQLCFTEEETTNEEVCTMRTEESSPKEEITTKEIFDSSLCTDLTLDIPHLDLLGSLTAECSLFEWGQKAVS